MGTGAKTWCASGRQRGISNGTRIQVRCGSRRGAGRRPIDRMVTSMKFGVVVFPGSNCDHDSWFAPSQNLGYPTEMIWHDSTSLGDVDAVILPGGFAYGDYLRGGAIAKFSSL